MRVSRARLVACAALIAAAGRPPAAPAADPPPPGVAAITPEQRLMSKRAAQADCYRLLVEKVFGLHIAGDTTVRDFVTQNDTVRSDVDHMIRGARFSDPRYWSDGSCEVDATVTLAQVVTTLKHSADRVEHASGAITSSTFDEITRTATESDVTVTGAGAAASGTSAVPDPATAPLPALDPTAPTRTDLPPIFARYPAQKRLMARRAAREDAYRLLHERIYGLRLASGTTVENLMAKEDRIRAQFDGRLAGFNQTQERYDPDGVVEVQLEVTLEQVVTMIHQSSDAVYRDGQWDAKDFEDIARRNERRVIAVVGCGALDTGRPVPSAAAAAVAVPDHGDVEVHRETTTTVHVGPP